MTKKRSMLFPTYILRDVSLQKEEKKYIFKVEFLPSLTQRVFGKKSQVFSVKGIGRIWKYESTSKPLGIFSSYILYKIWVDIEIFLSRKILVSKNQKDD